MDWTTIRGVIMDMDGVLWRGDEALPGMRAMFAALRGRGIPYALATNNSSKTPHEYVEKLARLGVADVQPHEIVTAATVTADYLRDNYPPGTRVHAFGMSGLKNILADAGFTLADEDVRVVVAGAKFDVTYDDLKRATFLIRGGADFIGTNDDPTFPTPEGLAPGSGSTLAALATASGQAPVVIGKPHAPMFEDGMKHLGTTPDTTLMIGDRLSTDILGAKRCGLRAVLVLTGVTTQAELDASDVQPDAVFAGLPDVMAAWGIG